MIVDCCCCYIFSKLFFFIAFFWQLNLFFFAFYAHIVLNTHQSNKTYDNNNKEGGAYINQSYCKCYKKWAEIWWIHIRCIVYIAHLSVCLSVVYCNINTLAVYVVHCCLFQFNLIGFTHFCFCCCCCWMIFDWMTWLDLTHKKNQYISFV